MASSIHTIYRPLARSRKEKLPSQRRTHRKVSSVSDADDDPTTEEPVLSEEDIDEDFEPTSSRNAQRTKQNLHISLPPLPEFDTSELSIKPHPARSGSMGTVKLQRRAKLAEKLREVFNVQGIEEVIAGTLRYMSALLQSS